MSRHGKMRASFDSEATSLGPSPPQSPPRNQHPVYFVQSPSRDSHDGDSKRSVQSTPMISPSASPLHHHHHSFSRASNASSADTMSGKLGSRKVSPHDSSARGGYRKKGYKHWVPGGTILEEEEQQIGAGGSGKKPGLSRCCMCGLSCLFCLVIFGFIFLIFWLVCQPRQPQLLVKDIVFNEFIVVDGSADGVPTRILTANSTLKLMFHNPSKYFGLHVSQSDVLMDYSQLSVGRGQIAKFFQAKGSKKTVAVNVVAVRVPLYGAGPNLQSLTQAGGGVPLQLKATLQSRAYVFGKLVKPRFRSYFSCDVTVNSSGKNFLKLLHKACTYKSSK